MASRQEFARALAKVDQLTHSDRAVALLWYYQTAQEYEERTAGELAADLHDLKFPKPKVARLQQDLRRSPCTTRGQRKGSFQIDLRRLEELDQRYRPLLRLPPVTVSDAVLPVSITETARIHVQKLAHELNGCYEYGFYDGCAVIARRLLESIIIDIYLVRGRKADIQVDGAFVGLERLVAHLVADPSIALSKNAPKDMHRVKQAGDIAAHDRNYITTRPDIDDLKSGLRRLMVELLALVAPSP